MNSSTLTVGDTTLPVLHDDSLSTSSGYTGNPFTYYINVSEANSMDYMKLQITDPNQNVLPNLTMSADSHVGNEYRYSVSYTPTLAGVYHLVVFGRDGSGNTANITSNLTYTASVYVPPVNNGDTGGGGSGGSTTSYVLQVFPQHFEINKYSFGDVDFSVIMRNAGSQDAVFRIKPTIGRELVKDIRNPSMNANQFITLKSGANTTTDITLTLNAAGTQMVQFQVVDQSGNDVPSGAFDTTINVVSGTSFWDIFRKNVMFPLNLDNSISPPTSIADWFSKVSISRDSITIPSSVQTSIPIGWLIFIFLIAVFTYILEKIVPKNIPNKSIVTFALSATIALIMFVTV